MPEHATSQKKAHDQLQAFLEDCGVRQTKGVRLIEIGSKNGLFLQECAAAGMDVTGTEIVADRVAWMRAEYPHLQILQNSARSIPAPSNTYDFVVSFQVLEHVSHLSATLDECIRILKPGGYMYHICPNYKSFYEGHYRVLWIPFLRKRGGTLYLRLLGKQPEYFRRSVFPVTPGRLRSLLHHKNDVEIISLGGAAFLKRFRLRQIRKVHNRALQRALMLLYRIGSPARFLLRIIGLAGVYYPITLIARKNSSGY